jgi:transcriptional regulator with XRE-family HTH domain
MIDYTVNPTVIGKRIRDLRLKQNKTQSYWADMLFISPSYLSLIEEGKRIPKLEVLIQLARVGEVSLDYLVFGDDSNSDSAELILNRMRENYPENKVLQSLRVAEFFLKASQTDDPHLKL